MASSELESRRQCYAESHSIAIDPEDRLGFGTDGAVWRTNRDTAVKVFEREENYCRERDSYQRLMEQEIISIDGFAVPRLNDCDDELLVVEMDIVSPPFVLDFGKCYLDIRPDFSPEVMADWEAEQRELREERWPAVQSILGRLEQVGIYYQDVRPGNIMFG